MEKYCLKCLLQQLGNRWLQTNHSFRGVTAATRLFQAGVDEQLIMKRTGHRSTDGVRIYKHISDQQNAGRCFLNNIIT
uniref:Tyr recombinase domain-containing protein n=1 Tax=Amphimedon queenslandica TaxID=400682 RepID=A0A1X7UEF4_AMPQE